MEELEDRLFDSEELKSSTQRKLCLADREVDDFKSLLLQRDNENARLRKELDQMNASVTEKSAARAEADTQRRELEHRIAILQTEAEQNERSQVKADKAADETEHLRRRTAEIIDQKAAKANQLSELEKKEN